MVRDGHVGILNLSVNIYVAGFNHESAIIRIFMMIFIIYLLQCNMF